MLEHVGVRERAAPYHVEALPEKRQLRAAAVAELCRVGRGAVVLDFPNGWFPVDFSHGDTVGAFRLDSIPDPPAGAGRSAARRGRRIVAPP